MLKIIAMLTMLIDHIGVIFFPDEDVWRIIGRIAFPLYAYFIAVGYQYTSDLKKYCTRLLLLALLCHIPVLAGMEMSVYNVIFTLFAGLMVIILLDKPLSLWLKITGLTVISAGAWLIPIDYGLYGVLTVVMFHYFKGTSLVLVYFALNALFIFGEQTSALQWFCMVALFFIFLQHKLPEVPVNRTFYWWFYPAHLMLLYAISLLI